MKIEMGIEKWMRLTKCVCYDMERKEVILFGISSKIRESKEF